MTTTTNQHGEKQTSWTSHKHPENPDFMQVVKYMHVVKPDGRNLLRWCLFNASANDRHLITDISLQEAIDKFTDKPEVEITEEMFQNWLKSRQ